MKSQCKLLASLLLISQFLIVPSYLPFFAVDAVIDADLLNRLAPDAIRRAFAAQESFLQERQQLMSSGDLICPRADPQKMDIATLRHHAILRPSNQTLNNAPLALIVERATADLAKQTSANADDVQQFSNVINVRQSPLGEQCPTNFQSDFVNCMSNLNIRTIDGKCNNLRNPLWGMSGTAFSRLLTARYEDGISQPRTSSHVGGGVQLPPARKVSTCVSPLIVRPHRSITIALVFYGQIIDHDLGLAPMARVDNEAQTDKIPPKCCGVDPQCRHGECFTMDLPADDPQYGPLGRTCMEFVRTVPALRESCRLGYREQVNEPTHYLDASFNYASTADRQRTTRAFVDGLLATSQSEAARVNNLELLPHSADNFECVSPDSERRCFFAGDSRVNENLLLTALHQVFLREHNRIARAFKDIALRTGRSTLDEDLYQAARKIVIAEVQYSVYNEFLPAILGNIIMSDIKNELELCTPTSLKPYCRSGYYTGYNDRVPPHVSHEFSTGAFRLGHTLLPEFFFRTFLDQGVNTEHRLADNFFNIAPVYEKGGVGGLLYGMLIKNAEVYDSTIVRSVRNDLFQERKSNRGVGMDLFALNLQRARDHGIAFYNDYRELCGLGRAQTFEDLLDVMDNATIARLRCAYIDVNDIELFAGGVAEQPVNNDDGVVGPTFSCIVAQQFHQTKKGDRFWFENPGQFTPAQLAELRKFRMSKMFCENTEIDRAQTFMMIQPTPSLNSERPCADIPAMNLEILATILPSAQARG